MGAGFDFSLLDAPVVRSFRGRAQQLEELTGLAGDDECSLIAILGMGGMGKSWLARQFIEEVRVNYELRVWVSLLNAPTWQEVAQNILRSIDASAPLDNGSASELLRHVHIAVSTNKCLLVLDNFESLMEPHGPLRGQLRPDHEGFAPLLRVLALASVGLTVVTSRERPIALDAIDAVVRTVALPGLSMAEAADLGRDAGLDAELDLWRTVVERFGGNPQLVKLAAASAIAMGGDLGAFLASRGDQLQGERELFEWHFARLSQREQSAMYWLAALRSSSGVDPLCGRFHPRLGPSDPSPVDLLRRLRDTAVVEWAPPDRISLQPAMLEFVTARLADRFTAELAGHDLVADGVLACQALMIASAAAPIRSSLRQLLIEPILMGLQSAIGSRSDIGRHLRLLLDRVRTRRDLYSSYAAGNLCNLLVAVEGDLSHLDFSKLTIRNADLSVTRLTQSKMIDAELVDAEIAQTFGNILACASNEEAGWIAAAGTDNDVWLWDRDGEQRARFVGHTNWVRDLAFNDNGTRLASVSSDGSLRVWDTTGAHSHLTVEAHGMRVWSVAWSGYGIVTASQDRTLRIWSEEDGSNTAVLLGHTAPVVTVDVSESGALAFSGDLDGVVRAWDLSAGCAVDDLTVGDEVAAVRAYGPDQLIVGTRDGRLFVVHHELGHLVGMTTLAQNLSAVNSVDVDTRGALVSSHDDGALAIWDLEQRRLVTRMGGHQSRATTARFRGQDLIVSGGEDQTIRLWDTTRWEMSDVLVGRASHAWSLALVASEGGPTRLLSAHEDGSVHVWRSSSNQAWEPRATWRRHRNRVWCVRADLRGVRAVSASEDGFATVWNVSDGAVISQLGDHESAVWAADFDASGQKVITACDDGTLRLWDIRNGSVLARIQAHHNRIRALACSPVEPLCVTGGEDFALRQWDTRSGGSLGSYDGHSDRVNAVAFDASGRRFASGGRDGLVALWEVGRPLPLWSFSAPEFVWAVALDPQGSRVAFGTESGQVSVIDVSPDAVPVTLASHDHRIKSLVFSADSALLISCSEEGNIKAIDVEAGRVEASFETPRAYEGLDITGVRGLSDAAIATLIALGAVNSTTSPSTTDLVPTAPNGFVFISYAREDLDYVRELAVILEHAGARVWLDQSEVHHGDAFADRLRAALDDAAAVVVVMSPSSAKSRWVRREVQYAESRSTPVFPILLDGEPFFELGDLHFEDVRGGRVPGEHFIDRVTATVTRF